MSEENLLNLLVFHFPGHFSVEGVSGEIQFRCRSKLQGKVLMYIVDVKGYFKPLKAKRRPLYLKIQSVLRCKHFSSRL